MRKTGKVRCQLDSKANFNCSVIVDIVNSFNIRYRCAVDNVNNCGVEVEKKLNKLLKIKRKIEKKKNAVKNAETPDVEKCYFACMFFIMSSTVALR